MILDYSYMMILELRDFDRQKYGALVQCRVSCQEIYEIAHHLCVRLDPDIRKVYDYTQAFRGTSSDEGLLRVAASGDRVQFGVSNAVRTLAGIRERMCAVYHRVSPPISLSRFKDGPSVYQVTVLFLGIYVAVVELLFALSTDNRCIMYSMWLVTFPYIVLKSGGCSGLSYCPS